MRTNLCKKLAYETLGSVERKVRVIKPFEARKNIKFLQKSVDTLMGYWYNRRVLWQNYALTMS